jgi:hypothetical protein
VATQHQSKLTGLNLSCNYLHTQHVLAFAQGLAHGEQCPLRALDLSSSCVDLASTSHGDVSPISKADLSRMLLGGQLLPRCGDEHADGVDVGTPNANSAPVLHPQGHPHLHSDDHEEYQDTRHAWLADPTWHRFACATTLLARLGAPLECKLLSICEQLPAPSREAVTNIAQILELHGDVRLVLE